MKTLIVFYSFEGNCRALASVMAEAVSCDFEELSPIREQVSHGAVAKYLMGGMASLLKETTPLQPLAAILHDYELVVVGGPVWCFNITPVVRTFLTETDWTGMRTALFSMHRGGRGRAIASMRELVEKRGGAVVGTAEFVDLRHGSAELTRKRAIDWITGLQAGGKKGYANDD